MTTRRRIQHRLTLERDEQHLLTRTWTKTPYHGHDHETPIIAAAVTRREYNNDKIQTETAFHTTLNPHPDDDARPRDHPRPLHHPDGSASPLYLPLSNAVQPWPK